MEFVLIGLIAFFTSAVSGMLGLGGAVLLIPSYLYIPSLFGVNPLDVKNISGMTTLQVFSASMVGALVHRNKGVVNTQLVLMMGIPMAVASLSGALVSGAVQPNFIIVVFALMAVLGAVLVVIKMENLKVEKDELKVSKIGAIGIATVVGFLGGIVGAPGAFLISPLMITVLNIPTRVTIGSTLGIVLLSAFSASVGKIVVGQVSVLPTTIAVLSSLPGVYLGSKFSHRIQTRTLRWALSLLISIVGIQMLYKIIQ